MQLHPLKTSRAIYLERPVWHDAQQHYHPNFGMADWLQSDSPHTPNPASIRTKLQFEARFRIYGTHFSADVERTSNK